MSARIVATGLKDLQRFYDAAPDLFAEAARLAINDTVTRQGMTLIKKDMREQVNFPDGYLEEGNRLSVARLATKGSLEAIIRGRDRPTSLARFAPGQTPESTRKQGVRVRVQRGKTKHLKRAFLVKLNEGKSLGLAVRLGDGETLDNTHAAKKLANNVWLLYGPSVEQVLSGVAEDRAEDIIDFVNARFIHQFNRLSNG